jgi:two-component system sensor histidine kinase MprB
VAGIFLALLAGLLVARSALVPVRRLTRVAEHVGATGDLSVRLPAEGRDEVGRLGRAFNKMAGALAQSRDRQQRLIADAGHELRTPLTSMRTNVDLMLRSERTGRALPPGREEAMLESVDQQLHELSGLVTDLLELSRTPRAASAGPCGSPCTRRSAGRWSGPGCAGPAWSSTWRSSPGTSRAIRPAWTGPWSTCSTTR